MKNYSEKESEQKQKENLLPDTNTNHIRKMRSWLNIKNSENFPYFEEDSENLFYGDGHSGWNR